MVACDALVSSPIMQGEDVGSAVGGSLLAIFHSMLVILRI